MRYRVLFLLPATVLGISGLLNAEPIVTPETGSYNTANVAEIVPPSSTTYGVVQETPNQKRIREGKPIVESFPPVAYGQLTETPNQRRKRLGQPLPADAEQGESKETPNQRRMRLASQTASLPQ